MTPLLRQVLSIAATDVRLRLRRPSTLWLILILSGMAYLLIPDPSTGVALMVVDGARALYTSQVVALATAGLASLFLTFAGFYLASNTIRRDLIARTGGIIAATPVSSGTYLVGKFLGGAAYLGLITGRLCPERDGDAPPAGRRPAGAVHLLPHLRAGPGPRDHRRGRTVADVRVCTAALGSPG